MEYFYASVEMLAGGRRCVNASVPLEALTAPRPRLLTARKFLAEFKPVESIIDGLSVGRGALVAVTGATGSGKTTLCAAIQVALRTGHRFAGREVTSGTVLAMAGENPDDYAMHLKATLQQLGIHPDELGTGLDRSHLMVIPGVFGIGYELDWLQEQIASVCSDVVAVFVDTSAAFYSAEDENDNVSMRRHASMLRELTNLPGNPTVFVLCHPTKNATKDNLQPRGGGAFLAEVDVNLTVWKDDAGIVTLHHTKIRGTPFDPIRFELVPVELEGCRDARDRPIFSVAARHLADERAEQLVAKELADENRLMLAMARKPEGSIADWAKACGFTSGMGSPQKSRVSRMLAALVRESCVDKARGGVYRLTAKGNKELDRVRC